jgi:hypothetical protein
MRRREQQARIDWQAQVVKTMGIRNAKPTAVRQVVDEYIQHVDTSTMNATNRDRGRRTWMPEGRQRWRCRGSSRLWRGLIGRYIVG